MAELIKKEGHQVEFKVEVPANEVNGAFDAVWKGLAQQVRVPGFRPGKAPRRVIEKRVGEGYAEGEVQNRLVNAHFPQAIRELELSLVDAHIEPQDVKSGQPFTFTVKGDLYPEVTLSDWKGLSLSAAAPEITDEVVDRTLADMQERAASFEQVERAIEASDQVTVEEEGEEGSYPIYMDMAGEHIQKALLGKNVGDEVEISVPAEEGEDDTPVKVKVLGIKSKSLPELNDEFAGTMQFENMDKLRATLREELERRAQSEGEGARREEFLSALIEGMTVDIPQSLIQRRQDELMSEIKNDLGRQGVRWSEYEGFMQEQGKLDEFMGELGKNAEQRVKRDLALGKLAEDLGVQVTDQEFGQNLMAMAQMNGMSPQELQSQMGTGGLNAFYTDILRSKALNQALAQLSGEGQSDSAEADGAKTDTAKADASKAADSEGGAAEADSKQDDKSSEE
ncbi:trigger factor [Deinococcus piscis]|uniref:Trigger factor n=1 Tax=Deinococcus piscis TaxID=394230 RepID=A0ABQ3K4A8_9DEIO|nr:trigger factor [Deinococcus piscis]GHG02531.1 trigger factor [Deinococcus piscis]